VVAIKVGVLVAPWRHVDAGISCRPLWLADLFSRVPQLPLLLLMITCFRDALKTAFGPGGRVFV